MRPQTFTMTHAQVRGGLPQGDDTLVRQAVAHAKDGSRTALQFLYVHYAADTHRYVHRIVGDHHEAEDITQSVFAKLMPTLSNYDASRAPFGAWLRRVARNAALDTLRGRWATPTSEVRVADPPEREHHVDLVQSMKQALSHLSHDQREVLILRHLVGLSPGEIAGVLHKTESAVHGLHHRARRNFKAALRDLDAMPLRV